MKEKGKRISKTFFFAPLRSIVLICLLVPLTAGAQKFTDRIQKNRQGEGTLVIHHDAAIDELVNGRIEVPTRPVQKTQKTPKKNTTPTPPPQQKPREDEPPKTEPVDTIPAVKRTHKANGYRIQVFAGNDSRRDQKQAMQQKSAVKALFPEHQVYVTYQHPRWLCRIGDFATYAEAQELLSEVRQSGYESATIVRARVNLPY